MDDAGPARGGDGEKRATVSAREPGNDASARDPLALRQAAEHPTADPTALPGSGARVVSRPTGSTRMTPGAQGGADPAGRQDTGGEGGRSEGRDVERDGEASRGRR
ncbi:hypothetical protein SHKM778_84690 [Streptomyces sp. KM77-8]|uniref:Uncharacterized protein n=1 Tax=Streptomyces haneummycinicus TaxID=3074435 RepID=A0AAT9HXU2_9ACTN